MPSWKEISRLLGFVLLFAVLAYNLYNGAGIFTSIYRSLIVYVIYGIIVIIVTNIVVKILSDYEMRRMLELSAQEEKEEEGSEGGGELGE